MIFNVLPIPAHLTDHIACIRTARHNGAERLTLNVCLNGLPGIVFQHHDGRSPVETIDARSRHRASIPTLYAYGQIMQPGAMQHKPGPFTTTQVVLKPHALPTLLGINAAALTNEIVDLSEFAARDLNLRLLEAQNAQAQVALLIDFLTARLQQASTRDALVEESLHLIHTHSGFMTVKTLLATLAISERQFERRFIRTVGVSPQFYIRIKRFNAAIRLMKTGRFERLTDVAHALNYYDQSHFIRDIKAFSGITPKSLFQKVAEFPLEQGVYAYR
jgi:AraC-like DNA-binding protein